MQSKLMDKACKGKARGCNREAALQGSLQQCSLQPHNELHKPTQPSAISADA